MKAGAINSKTSRAGSSVFHPPSPPLHSVKGMKPDTYPFIPWEKLDAYLSSEEGTFFVDDVDARSKAVSDTIKNPNARAAISSRRSRVKSISDPIHQHSSAPTGSSKIFGRDLATVTDAHQSTKSGFLAGGVSVVQEISAINDQFQVLHESILKSKNQIDALAAQLNSPRPSNEKTSSRFEVLNAARRRLEKITTNADEIDRRIINYVLELSEQCGIESTVSANPATIAHLQEECIKCEAEVKRLIEEELPICVQFLALTREYRNISYRLELLQRNIVECNELGEKLADFTLSNSAAHAEEIKNAIAVNSGYFSKASKVINNLSDNLLSLKNGLINSRHIDKRYLEQCKSELALMNVHIAQGFGEIGNKKDRIQVQYDHIINGAQQKLDSIIDSNKEPDKSNHTSTENIIEDKPNVALKKDHPRWWQTRPDKKNDEKQTSSILKLTTADAFAQGSLSSNTRSPATIDNNLPFASQGQNLIKKMLFDMFDW